MNIPTRNWKKVFFVANLLLLVLLVCNNGCMHGVTLDKDKERKRNKAYAEACAPFAAMCALAYEKPNEQEADTKEGKLEIETRRVLKESLMQGGWSQTSFTPSTTASNLGLYYEVWINNEYLRPVVAIALRGTEGADLKDWSANLWWFNRCFSNNQYEQVSATNDVDRVMKTYIPSNAIFITTGHSLGGGLAQRLRYVYPTNIEQCYAFNSSPVTGFSGHHGKTPQEGKKDRDQYNELLPIVGFPPHRTLRVYEKREILAFFRAQLRLFFDLDDKMMEVRWNLNKTRSSIGNHAMLGFAAAISQVATNEVDLSKDYQPWWQGRETISRTRP